MKTKFYLIAGVLLALSSNTFAGQYSSLKCHLALEDNSTHIRHFSFKDQDTRSFVANLVNESVFMSDGVTQKKIVDVYECIARGARFSTEEANELEERTGF